MASTEEYVRRISEGQPAVNEERRLTPMERLEEALFTGLRLSAGLDLEAVGGRYGIDVWKRFGPRLVPFVEGGLLVRDGARLRLTREGMLLANEIMAVFV